MKPTKPTADQATAYFMDMANGKSVPIAPGIFKGLGVARTPSIYHVITPTDQALFRARETVKRQKVIRGSKDEPPIKKFQRESVKSKKKKTSGKQKSKDYLMPGLD